MRVYEREFNIPSTKNHEGLVNYLPRELEKRLGENETPIRFVVSESSNKSYSCEIGVIDPEKTGFKYVTKPIFEFKKRLAVNSDAFNAVVIIPTGIGAKLGGHAGDANRLIKLFGSVCDNIITHPNAVNAADINEMPDNCLYIEGSLLSRFLMGTIGLQKVRSNKLLVIADELRNDTKAPKNKMFTEATINAVSAARATLGIEVTDIVLMENKIEMTGSFASSGRAVGSINNIENLFEVIEECSSNNCAIALSTVIKMNRKEVQHYYDKGLVNPWGGIEAILTHTLTSIFDLPAAHSPMLDSIEILNMDVGIVDPRIAAEVISLAAFHCVLKGLHKSPQVVSLEERTNVKHLLTSSDVSCLVTPDGCLGLPHIAAIEQGIPVIAIKNSQSTMKNNLRDFPFHSIYFAENYLEALGMMLSIKEGIDPISIKEELKDTSHLLKKIKSMIKPNNIEESTLRK